MRRYNRGGAYLLIAVIMTVVVVVVVIQEEYRMETKSAFYIAVGKYAPHAPHSSQLINPTPNLDLPQLPQALP